jgi:purine-binding chemotaxis protein CheW
MNPQESSVASRRRGGKYLTFRLGAEEYGLEITKVREIVGLMPITRVPGAPADVRGVVNLRGRIIPTVDLRLKFHLALAEDSERTCIVIVNVTTPRGSTQLGIVVDEVAEVLDLREEQIDHGIDLSAGLTPEFVLGLGLVEERVKILLDIDKVLSAEDVRALDTLQP